MKKVRALPLICTLAAAAALALLAASHNGRSLPACADARVCPAALRPTGLSLAPPDTAGICAARVTLSACEDATAESVLGVWSFSLVCTDAEGNAHTAALYALETSAASQAEYTMTFFVPGQYANAAESWTLRGLSPDGVQTDRPLSAP